LKHNGFQNIKAHHSGKQQRIAGILAYENLHRHLTWDFMHLINTTTVVKDVAMERKNETNPIKKTYEWDIQNKRRIRIKRFQILNAVTCTYTKSIHLEKPSRRRKIARTENIRFPYTVVETRLTLTVLASYIYRDSAWHSKCIRRKIIWVVNKTENKR
jgi:hypothetical protein